MTAKSPINPRLLDAVAMCLCWAEFHEAGAERPADETPASYWASMQQDRREVYYADAELIARFMAGDRSLRLVPAEAPDDALLPLLGTYGRLAGLGLAARRWAEALKALPRFLRKGDG